MTALFGFTAMFVGAAFSWSSITTVAIAVAAATGSIPQRQYGLSLVVTAGAIVVLAACSGWLYGAFVWVRSLRSLRVVSLALIAAPFLLGVLPFGRGILSSFWN